MGNLMLGWNTYFIPAFQEKVMIFPKDKLFCQSSVGSQANFLLLKN